MNRKQITEFIVTSLAKHPYIIAFAICMAIKKQIPCVVFGSVSAIFFMLVENGIVSLVPKKYQNRLVFGTYIYKGKEVSFTLHDFFITRFLTTFNSYNDTAVWLIFFYCGMMVIYTAIFMFLSVYIGRNSEIISG